MVIGGVRVEPGVALAPMSGINDRSFRLLCREAGARLTYTGLVSANAVRFGSAKTMGLLSFDSGDHPVCAQVFGAEPEVVAAAAATAVERGADMVDINMGCAVPKVLKARAGAALMGDPERAEAMVREAVKAAAPRPVGVKIRRGQQCCGWRGGDAVTFARRCEAAGAAAIAVHPRWANQGFGGRAEWSVVAAVKEAVSIPVIGNGDVRGGQDAVRLRAETGCDGVMVGRACLGNPWVLGEVAAALSGEPVPAAPSVEERVELAARHLAMAVEEHGERVGVRTMRKHLAWYLKGMRNAAALRARINECRREGELREVLEQARPGTMAAASGHGG